MFKSMLAAVVVAVMGVSAAVAQQGPKDKEGGKKPPSVEPAVIVDSLNQVIGQAINVSLLSADIVFRMDDGRVTTLQVSNAFDLAPVIPTPTIFGSYGDKGPQPNRSPMKFQNTNCTPPGFIVSQKRFDGDVPLDTAIVRTVIGPPGRTLYAVDPDPVFEDVDIQSAYNHVTLTCEPQIFSNDGGIRVHPVQELNFEPPFRIP